MSFLCDLCVFVWVHKNISQRTQRGTKLFFLCDLCVFVWDHKNISHRAAKNTEGHKVFLIFVSLCGFIKIFHTKPQRTQRGTKKYFTQSHKEHKGAQSFSVIFVSLCGFIKIFHTEPQRTQRGTKFFCDLCVFMWNHKNISHKAAKNTKLFCLFSVFSVSLCGIIKIFHTEPQRTQRDTKLFFLCDLCVFVWDHTQF